MHVFVAFFAKKTRENAMVLQVNLKKNKKLDHLHVKKCVPLHHRNDRLLSQR